MKHLISLKEWNESVANSIHDPLCNESRPNGISCEKCGGELSDTNPNMILTSLPPKKNVHCPKCGWRGYRLA